MGLIIKCTCLSGEVHYCYFIEHREYYVDMIFLGNKPSYIWQIFNTNANTTKAGDTFLHAQAFYFLLHILKKTWNDKENERLNSFNNDYLCFSIYINELFVSVFKSKTMHFTPMFHISHSGNVSWRTKKWNTNFILDTIKLIQPKFGWNRFSSSKEKIF